MAGPSNGALARFRVIDLTRVRSGPTAVRQLADWGAQVIKVESIGDDGGFTSRDTSDFQNLHRNKRCITLNLKEARGREVLRRMVERADVLVENYRPSVKHRLGIDYETLRGVNPRLVYASISGFGQDGPYAERPGFDQVAQGMGGLMSVTGLPGQGPVRVGIPIADLGSGLYCAIGILTALLEREASGEGQWVQTSLLQAQIALLDFQATRWLIDHEVPPQAGNDHPTAIPTGVFPTTDGHINIAVGGQPMWVKFCEAMGAPEWSADERFRNGPLRSKNRAELNALIAERTRTRSAAEWIESLNDAGVPCGAINRIDQVFEDPQVRHLGIAQTVEHPRLGRQTLVGQPIMMSRSSSPLVTATPELGEHTDQVLAELGYDASEIGALRADGIV